MKPFRVLETYAVPCFMLISFILSEKYITQSTWMTTKKRIDRLIWPYIFWGTVNWCIFIVCERVLHVDIVDGFSALLWQLITGCGYHVNTPLWYMACLIWLTLIYVLIFKLPNRNISLLVIHILLAISLLLQYTGINYYLFAGLRWELCYSLGRICEMIPYATIGYDISYFGLYKKLAFKAKVIIPIAIVFLYILLYEGIYPSVKGFGYQGVSTVIIAILMVSIAYLTPILSVGGI
jgi:fucose 4-O-acetylase-like acetyltransferase